MNIIAIKTGQFYDTDYSEYLFKTNLDVRKIFDENLNMTEEFIGFLKEHNYNHLLQQYNENRKYFEIDFYYDNNIDEVKF